MPPRSVRKEFPATSWHFAKPAYPQSGKLGTIDGGMGLLGSLVHPFFCRRFHSRTLLVLAIICTTASNLG